MQEFIITGNDAGQRLDSFLGKAAPLLPASLMQKGIRTKNIKVNGKRAERGQRLCDGDIVRLYLDDRYFEKPAPDSGWKKVTAPKLHVVYEDSQILLVDKRPGIAVHPHDGAEYGRTLIDQIQAYLYARGEWDPKQEHAFAPALCNRIDRNTGGIVIAAKTAMALRVMNQKSRDRELGKYYLAIVKGAPRPAQGVLKGYLFKDAVKNRVYVADQPQKGSKTAQTKYRTLASSNGLSLVECELITGRTHQIRAQFAHAGCPLLGDGKYGTLGKNAPRKYQALYAYRLKFRFTTPAEDLEYLNGASFRVDDVDFVQEYFPAATLSK